MTHEWRLVRSGSCSPAWNMAVDEAMYRLMKHRAIPPSLRLFRWSPAAVSFGRFQDLGCSEIQGYLRQGYPLVRRPTGGLAVLHEGDLSYAMVGVPGESGFATHARGLYLQAHESLQGALTSLGVQSALYAGDERRPVSGLCNAAPMRSDLILDDGRKIGGSAQVRGGGVVLQHGSIHVPADIDLDRFEEEVRRAFERIIVLRLVEAALSPAETELAMYLAERKYSCDEWNHDGHSSSDVDGLPV
jgi:lipoate-protein ligase A